jgi:glucosyl-3-phosphoglycerate synthase
MADFYQTGVVTTLHRLTPNSIERLEADLEKFSRNKPIGLVLPALYSEFETLAMQRIVPELRKVRYLQRIVVVLAKATPEQFERARSFFDDFYTPVTVLWVDSGSCWPDCATRSPTRICRSISARATTRG